MKKITITEGQYRNLKKSILEGIEWSKNPNNTVNLHINNDSTDKGNVGEFNADTRVFGSKNDILHGDNTLKNGGIYQKSLQKKDTIEFYQNVINFVKNGRIGGIKIPQNVNPASVTAVDKWFLNGNSDRWIIDAATKNMNRTAQEGSPYINTVDRISASEDEKNARYITGTVADTGIKYIALFTMGDFNFSDAIKHGTLRQNDSTDKLFGITSDEREKNGKWLSQIGVTYDNKYAPDIAQNFSLKDVKDGHYKQQFGLNGEGGYSSVSQFLDKSVNYASYALKKENYTPDFIVAPPSSSNFNKYYCTNLSNKLGIPFREDFFKRNIINVKFDSENDTEMMLKKGFSQKDIMDFENQVKTVAYKEIANFVSSPIKNLIENYKELFSNISVANHSREKLDIDSVFDCLMIYVYRTIVNLIQNENDIVEQHLVKNFMQKQNKLYQKNYDSNHVLKQIITLINLKIGKKVFNGYMVKTYNIVKQYSNMLKERGYKLNFNVKQVKITQFPMRFRPFLHNVYIIADDYMSNGKIMSQYQNAKFLIFDEDINSGATLKLCIDALEEKLPDINKNNVICLVNAYSSKSF